MHIRMATVKKTEIISVDEDMERLELSSTVGGTVLCWPKSSFWFFCKMLRKNPNELFGQPNRMVQLGNSTVVPQNIKHRTIIWSSNLGIDPEEFQND